MGKPCCGGGQVAAPAPANPKNQVVKLPDGTYAEVTSAAEGRQKRQEVYAQMREKSRTAWTAVES
jgi:hypothetical protein